MVNPLNRIFRRRPAIDEVEVGLLHSRVLARLRRPDQSTEAQPADETATDGAAGEVIDPMATEGRFPPSDTTYVLPANAVGVMAEPNASTDPPTSPAEAVAGLTRRRL